MNRKNIKYSILALMVVVVAIITSCKKDYYHDGGTSNGVFKQSIYDFLKDRPTDFDTVVQILDSTGLADVLKTEQGITFFAPKDAAVMNFIIAYNGDRLDLIPKDTLRKYMAKYIFKTKIFRDDITPDLYCNDYSQCDWVGDFKVSYDNYSMAMNLRPTDYNGVKNAGPRFIRFWDPRNKPYSNKDSVNRYWNGGIQVITSNLQATNGNIQVLDKHVFGFYKKGQ